MVRTRYNLKHTGALAALVLVALACQRSDDRPAPAGSEADLDVTDLIQYDTASADARDGSLVDANDEDTELDPADLPE
jgi:hypothetical protein